MIMAIIEGFFGLINGMVSVMPVLSIDQSIIDGTNNFINLLNSLNLVFPVAALMTSLTVIMGYHAFTMAFYLINWVIRKIPTVS